MIHTSFVNTMKESRSLSALSSFRTLLESKRALGAFLHYIFIAGLSCVNAGANETEELRYILEKFLVKKKLIQATMLADAESSAKIALTGEGNETTNASKTALDRIDGKALCSLMFAFATRSRDTSSRSPKLPAEKHSPSQTSPRARASELVRWASHDHEAREALGINTWEGKDYYNKEKFDALLELWPCFALLENALARIASREKPSTSEIMAILTEAADIQAFEVCDIAHKAEERSCFRVADLIAIIEND